MRDMRADTDLSPSGNRNIIASVEKIPPCDSEYPGYLRLLYLIQQGTQSSTPTPSQMGYLLTEAMISFNNPFI